MNWDNICLDLKILILVKLHIKSICYISLINKKEHNICNNAYLLNIIYPYKNYYCLLHRAVNFSYVMKNFDFETSHIIKMYNEYYVYSYSINGFYNIINDKFYLNSDIEFKFNCSKGIDKSLLIVKCNFYHGKLITLSYTIILL